MRNNTINSQQSSLERKAKYHCATANGVPSALAHSLRDMSWGQVDKTIAHCQITDRVQRERRFKL